MKTALVAESLLLIAVLALFMWAIVLTKRRDNRLSKVVDTAGRQGVTMTVGEAAALEDAAKILYSKIRNTGYRMVDVDLTGTDSPLAFIFAEGDRAYELRAAFADVRRRHVDDDGKLKA